MKRMSEIFPPVDELLTLPVEEVAQLLLFYLNGKISDTKNEYSLWNLTQTSNPELAEYASGERFYAVVEVIAEAWNWLTVHSLLAPLPQENWYFITRAGRVIQQPSDFEIYRQASFWLRDTLDQELERSVRPLFLKGEYDTAIFRAYRAVETRVRKKAKLPNSKLGTALMHDAFHPQTGALRDVNAEVAENEAQMKLFAGAIGLFKNPSSHRDVAISGPAEAIEMIKFANYLLRITDRATIIT